MRSVARMSARSCGSPTGSALPTNGPPRSSPCVPAGAAARLCWRRPAGSRPGSRRCSPPGRAPQPPGRLPRATGLPLTTPIRMRRAPAASSNTRPAGSGPPAGHRDLQPLPSALPGTLRIAIASSASQEATVVADALRRAHLHDHVPWSSMAVLVRSVIRQVPLLRRALAAAGVPVAIAGDELPLEAEPGVRPLLLLLRCALRPGTLDEDAATELLAGPLGGTDALGLRRLRRSAACGGTCRRRGRAGATAGRGAGRPARADACCTALRPTPRAGSPTC